MRTLTRDGTLGHLRPYEFISDETIIRYLMDEESDVSLTIGLGYRNPERHEMTWADAIRWIEANKGHVFEAYSDDGTLHVSAIPDGRKCA